MLLPRFVRFHSPLRLTTLPTVCVCMFAESFRDIWFFAHTFPSGSSVACARFLFPLLMPVT